MITYVHIGVQPNMCIKKGINIMLEQTSYSELEAKIAWLKDRVKQGNMHKDLIASTASLPSKSIFQSLHDPALAEHQMKQYMEWDTIDATSYAIQALRDLPKHLGQHKYIAEEYIKVINSIHYNEMRIFKPISFLEYAMEKAKQHMPMLIERQLLRLDGGMYPRLPKIYEEKSCIDMTYVLNYGVDDPFYLKRKTYPKQLATNLMNYDLYILMYSDKPFDEIKKGVKHLLIDGSHWENNQAVNDKVTPVNMARLRMLDLI